MPTKGSGDKGKANAKGGKSGTSRGKRGGAGDDAALVGQDGAFRHTMDRLDHEFREMERRMETMFQDLPFDWSRLGPVFHGWSLVPGRFGTPIIERFGSLASNLEAMAEGWRRPLMDFDVDDKQGLVTATCEMPGVKKDQIEVTVTGEVIEVRADTEDRRYHGKLSVGEALDAEHADATYEDGILTVTVPVETPNKERPRSVPVK